MTKRLLGWLVVSLCASYACAESDSGDSVASGGSLSSTGGTGSSGAEQAGSGGTAEPVAACSGVLEMPVEGMCGGIQTELVASAPGECDFPLWPPGAGGVTDWHEMAVGYQDAAGASWLLPSLADGACAGENGGFWWSSETPPVVSVCPCSCALLREQGVVLYGVLSCSTGPGIKD
ncbi:MAG: hypothetical protein QM756_27430 [Polyangiaceae bacterium]